jgi:hypothetical protein
MGRDASARGARAFAISALPRRAQNERERDPPKKIVRRNRGAERPRDLAARGCPDEADRPEDFAEEPDEHNRPVPNRIAARAEVSDAVHADHHAKALPNAAARIGERLHADETEERVWREHNPRAPNQVVDPRGEKPRSHPWSKERGRESVGVVAHGASFEQ